MQNLIETMEVGFWDSVRWFGGNFWGVISLII